MGYLDKLKKNKSRIEELRSKMQETSGPGRASYKDDRMWEPTVDKDGNGSATIRFLPEPEGEDFAFVQLYTRNFKNEQSNRWYIENCRTTIGEEDPVGAVASALWATGDEDNRNISRKYSRKLRYISNILVVDDPKHPEFNGRVMLYKYPKTIYAMLMDAVSPTYEDDVAIDPFDPINGADFKLRIKNGTNGYRTYEKSSWANPSRVAETDEEIEKILQSMHSLKAFHDPSNFKSYEELQRKFVSVVGDFVGSGIPTSPNATQGATPPPSPERSTRRSEVEDDDVQAPKPRARRAPVVEDDDEDDVPVTKPATRAAPTVSDDDEDEDEDEDLAMFKKYAAG